MGKSKPEFTYQIEDIVGIVKESDTHDWVKCVMKVKWNNNPATLDIRSMNMKDKRLGKGISLSNEDVDSLVNILIENDYGSLEELEKAIRRKKSFFTINNDDNYVIEI